jgi:hypothetical protein
VNEFEKKMLAEGRCIVCGQKPASGSKECKLCIRLRTGRTKGIGDHFSGGGSNIKSEFDRRMGVSPGNGGEGGNGDKDG